MCYFEGQHISDIKYPYKDCVFGHRDNLNFPAIPSHIHFSNAGAIANCVAGELELAKYFLAVLNLNNEYKKWGKLPAFEISSSSSNRIIDSSSDFKINMKKKNQSSSDHTQVHVPASK